MDTRIEILNSWDFANYNAPTHVAVVVVTRYVTVTTSYRRAASIHVQCTRCTWTGVV